MLHMNAYLVSAAGFQYTLHQCDITETFHHLIMCDGFLTMLTIGVGGKLFPEAQVPADMGYHRPFVFPDIAPNKGHILPPNRMIKKLLCQHSHALFGLGQYNEPAGVFIDAVHQAKSWQ